MTEHYTHWDYKHCVVPIKRMTSDEIEELGRQGVYNLPMNEQYNHFESWAKEHYPDLHDDIPTLCEIYTKAFPGRVPKIIAELVKDRRDWKENIDKMDMSQDLTND